MKNLALGWLWLLAAVSIYAHAEWQALSRVDSVQILPDGVDLAAGPSRIRVTALSARVLRLRYASDGSFPVDQSLAVLPEALKDQINIQAKQSSDAVEFEAGAIRVRILKSPLRIVFLHPDGQVILQDHPNYPVAFNGTAFRVWKSMPLDEHYFGLGDKASPIDHRDQAFTMWNTDAYGYSEGTDPLYKSIPFFMGLRQGRAFGVFLNNTYRTSFDFGKEYRDAFSFGAEAGDLDYFFIYGPSPKEVLESFARLVGRSPLPPKFVLGYQQSRYSYSPESQVRELAREFRKRSIPCDLIYLDIDYEDGYRSFTIDRNRFPDFEGMVRDLGQQGFKLVTIVDPHLKKEPGYRPYDEGMQQGYFVKNPDGSVYVGKVWPGDSVFPDLTRGEVRRWFGSLYAGLVRMGIRGFWNDMNEPAVFRYPERTMPLDTVQSFEGRTTDHREVHNVYGMENARATYEGMLQLRPNLRPYVLTRAGFAGSQRYAATWTGDNAATWTHYRLTVPMLLSLGLSGYPLGGVDEGGFSGSPTPELLTRWTELGTFLPLFRNHSDKGTRTREPWIDGPEHESIRRGYIETRYRLMPYVYTTFEETSRTGIPLMRPMFLEFPNDPAFETTDKEFMFGADLLVAPANETVDGYEVKLPAGDWYDFWTGRRTESHTLRVNPPIHVLPVYVRGGSIVPEQPVVQNVDQVPNGPLELSVYPGPNCRGSVYDDDGNTFAYQRGEFLRMQFTCEVHPDSVRVDLSEPQGTFRPWWTAVKITVFGASAAPHKVMVNGIRVSDWKYENESTSVTLTVSNAHATSVVLQN
jgi:alpha-glucosidase